MAKTTDVKLLNDTLDFLNEFVSRKALGLAKKHKLTGEVRVRFKDGNPGDVDLRRGNSWHWRILTKKEEKEWGVL